MRLSVIEWLGAWWERLVLKETERCSQILIIVAY
jgi:hypothetical protein